MQARVGDLVEARHDFEVHVASSGAWGARVSIRAGAVGIVIDRGASPGVIVVHVEHTRNGALTTAPVPFLEVHWRVVGEAPPMKLLVAASASLPQDESVARHGVDVNTPAASSTTTSGVRARTQ